MRLAPAPTRTSMSGVELHALAFDLDPAGAREHDEDLLLAALGVVVLGVVAVVRRQLDHLHAERGHAELGAGLDEAAAEGGLHVI